MKKAITIFLCLLVLTLAFPQEETDLKEAFLDAEYFMMYEEYKDALPSYLLVLESYPDNANINYRIGVCYLNISGQKDKSISYLEKAVQNTTEFYREGNFREEKAPVDVYFYLGNAYQVNGDLNKANQTYKKYIELLDPADTLNLEFVNQQIKACETAKSLMNKKVYFETINVGENINDRFSNFNPLVSGDESIMIYMSSRQFQDAIFFSKKVGENWSEPENILPQIQTEDIYSVSLSFDGKELYMSKDDNFDSELYISRLQDGIWSRAEKLNKNINTKYWESHACVSPDGKTLYFTSNKKGGFGGLDIYKSERNSPSEEWGHAVNIGPEINSKFNEDTPFLTSDGNTLFFGSQGHNNIGGFDIFYSTKLENGTWSKPVNIGYPINTTDDNLFFVPVNNGINAYYSIYQTDKGFGLEDIYRLEIYSDKNPREVIVNGTVEYSKKPEDTTINTEINVVDKSSLKILEQVEPDKESGRYLYTTNIPGNYKMVFERKDYQPVSKDFIIPDDYSIAEINLNVELKPFEEIVLRSIYFDFDDYSVKESEELNIAKLYEIMYEYPDLKIEVIGHTDAIGPAWYNKRLSAKRAKSIVNYLINKGIDKKRLMTKAVGENDHIAINSFPDGSDCPEGRKFNRRADMFILESVERPIITEEIDVPEELRYRLK
jgi:outer membrane protein OmpA-like peptidoglycan-associated protein